VSCKAPLVCKELAACIKMDDPAHHLAACCVTLVLSSLLAKFLVAGSQMVVLDFLWQAVNWLCYKSAETKSAETAVAS